VDLASSRFEAMDLPFRCRARGRELGRQTQAEFESQENRRRGIRKR
jgi:hypothetical protein